MGTMIDDGWEGALKLYRLGRLRDFMTQNLALLSLVLVILVFGTKLSKS